MAMALEEGEECPVCGSTHHPKKITTNVTIPREKRETKLKIILKNLI